MLDILKGWKGRVEVNGQSFDSIELATSQFKAGKDGIHIKLHPLTQTRQETESVERQPIVMTPGTHEYKITVKKYMTETSTPSFDFMEKWNKNNPMPFRTMIGWMEKETKGMAYMHLHGDIWAKTISTCMCCGRVLTNPVSQFFGIGPECGGHNYTHPFNTEQELRDAVAAYRTKLQSITWEGWVVKSAIIEMEEIKND